MSGPQFGEFTAFLFALAFCVGVPILLLVIAGSR